MKQIEVRLDGRGLRVGMVVARFNPEITLRLRDGCAARLAEIGCADVDVFSVAGAFEIPLIAQQAARTGRYHALVAIAAVIRGDTAHFDYVCNAVTDGVGRVGLDTGVPIAFCVLTTDDDAQALERAALPGEPGVNKGREAAEVAVEMARLLEALARPGRG
jgi:6,7-dimethyl-8-ribityllumazine synthase